MFLYFHCFNTASVLIQRLDDFEKLFKLAFQYSFCSYSTQFGLMLSFSSLCFNTASVLIQRPVHPYSQRHKIRFNTASVLIQLNSFVLSRFKRTGFNTASVLIQPYVITDPSGELMFQYSFCSYSTTSTGQKGEL